MKIILIGFMGSGKSSVAKKLNQLLNWPVIEMDELSLKKTGNKDMHEMFAKEGEILLRQTEISLAQEYASIDNHIVSTGAGVVINKIVLDYLKKQGDKIFHLNANFNTLSLRLQNDTSRPLFKNAKEAETLYHFRQPLYLKYADQVVDVDTKSLDEVAQEILASTVIEKG
jgi:shikimate kinase